ncbi:MAG: TonB-dependent receptor [Gammaproteobacteria bacterium]|nr:TonB-dependent receptor [Gammaproteobacteria bacterium]
MSFKPSIRSKAKTVLGIIGGAAFVLGSQGLLAQAVKDAANEKNNGAKSKAKVLEVVEVQGVRSALEDALNIKRQASSIVDAISAKDIDALPALDIGEALQAVPGIQLERSGEGRQSEISLRGLSGGFVKTTAFGQSFATPSRSFSDVGDSNPFSAFESGVFDGVTVVKAPTAAMQTGGIAGIIDKQLQQALSKPDGKFSLSVGGRYEELTENIDESIKFSGSKHIIDNTLAIAFKAATSGQTFRRDTANFTTYAPLGDNPQTGRNNSLTIDAYKAKYGLPDNADVRAASSIRNVTEYSDGDRTSFTGNIEWAPTEELKLGAHILYTKRDLSSGTKQDAQFSAGYNQARPTASDRFYFIEPDMDSVPFLYDTTASGNPVYGVSKVSITDGAYQFTNRETTFLEESKGIFLYGDYVVDKWTFDSKVTHSRSENQFNQIGLDFRHTGHQNARTRVNGVFVDTVPTGIDIELDTAFGNLDKASVAAQGWDNYTYDVDWQSPTSLTGVGLTTADPLNGNRRLQHVILGRVDNPKREVSSAEINAKREVDFGFGNALTFEKIAFGFRHSLEVLDNEDHNFGPAGINADAIGNHTINTNLVSDDGAPFFNGEFPGTFTAENGWQSLNNLEHIAALQNPLADVEGCIIIEPTGFCERFIGPHPQRYATNFSVDQSITAAYAMTDFAGQIGSIPYTGNIGFRYVTTDNKFDGTKRDQINGDVLVPVTLKDDYDHLLPSLNLAFDLHEDVVLRFSYNEGFARPNLRILTPTTAVGGGNRNYSVTKPGSSVRPYDAENFDVSLEWYNREGSAISVGAFYKEITGLFDRVDSCPEGDPIVIDAIGSDITREDNPETGGFTCVANEQFETDEGELVNPEVRVQETINSDTTIELTGFEVAIQQKLDFLPYPWNGFGGVFNYTRIDQDSKAGSSGLVDSDITQLYQVAPESYNIIGYYENDGFSIRLAYNWKDDSLLKGQTSFLGTLPRVQEDNGRLDLSASYQFSKNFKVFLRGYNLTDEKRYEYWGFDRRAVSRVDYTGRIYEASFNYNF